MRKIQFQNEYFYHIFNRGVDKREVFGDEKDYLRFLLSLREFNTTEQIESLYQLKKTQSTPAPKALYSALGATDTNRVTRGKELNSKALELSSFPPVDYQP